MKPSNFRRSDEFGWKCMFVKKCGIQAYQTTNGTLHWYKKSKKKMKKALDIYSALFVSLGMKINKKRNNL